MLAGFDTGGFVAPLRLGDNEREAMAMGLGDAISMSMGVPAWPTNIVWARPNGVLVLLFLSSLDVSGLSIEYSVLSVFDA